MMYFFSMPVPEKYLSHFTRIASIMFYNRTNNKEKLFMCDENRRFFLRKYSEYLSPFPDTYCWCLLPTHFHLLVKVKSIDAIATSLKAKTFNGQSLIEKKIINELAGINDVTGEGFKKFFQSYSLGFNKMHKRQGNLFDKPYKGLEIIKESHFTQAIVYIHANPLKHKIIKDFTKYRWSSWKTIVSDKPG